MCFTTGNDRGESCALRSGVFHVLSDKNVNDLAAADPELVTQPVERFRRLGRHVCRYHLQVFRRTPGTLPCSAPVSFGLFHNFTNFAIN